MSQDKPTGLPTQAIHESYLDMHRSFKAVRQARDRGRGVQQAHGELQDAVLTCFDLLRPHIRTETATQDYWHGEPPAYGEGPPDPDDGTAILAVQEHTDMTALNGHNPQEIDGFREWHRALGLSDTRRLETVYMDEGKLLYKYQEYQMGLHRLDEWGTDIVREQTTLDGFFGTDTRETVTRKRVPVHKLRRAVRCLSDVCDQLNLLTDINSKRDTFLATDDDHKEPFGEAEPPK